MMFNFYIINHSKSFIMRITKIISIIILSVAVAMGCSKKSENQSGSAQEMTEESAKKAKAEFQKNRDKFISESRSRLDSLEKELTDVGKQISGMTGETSRKLEGTWSKLKKQTETIRKNLEKLKDATQQNWVRLKSTAKDQIDYLESQISKLKKEVES